MWHSYIKSHSQWHHGLRFEIAYGNKCVRDEILSFQVPSSWLCVNKNRKRKMKEKLWICFFFSFSLQFGALYIFWSWVFVLKLDRPPFLIHCISTCVLSISWHIKYQVFTGNCEKWMFLFIRIRICFIQSFFSPYFMDPESSKSYRKKVS